MFSFSLYINCLQSFLSVCALSREYNKFFFFYIFRIIFLYICYFFFFLFLRKSFSCYWYVVYKFRFTPMTIRVISGIQIKKKILFIYYSNIKLFYKFECCNFYKMKIVAIFSTMCLEVCIISHYRYGWLKLILERIFVGAMYAKPRYYADVAKFSTR